MGGNPAIAETAVFELLRSPAKFTEAEAKRLVEKGSAEAGASGQVLITEGTDITTSMDERYVYLVLSGSAMVSRGGVVVGQVREGDFVGETRVLEVEALSKLASLRDDPVESLFKDIDSDASGKLDKVEIIAAASKYGINLTNEQADQLILKLDKDSDGEVSLGEVKKVAEFTKNKKEIQSTFRKADKDGSGLIDADEIRTIVREVAGVELTDTQARKLLDIIAPKRGKSLKLEDAITAAQGLLQKSEKLETAFNDFDVDGSGRINLSELNPLLKSVGIELSQDQTRILAASLDLNNDQEMDLQEFESAIARLEEGVSGRFGNAMRLFEAVAFNTQKKSLHQVKIAGSGCTFVRWSIKDILAEMRQDEVLAGKLKTVWGLNLVQKMREVNMMRLPEEADPELEVPEMADYGFGGQFLYGKFGDFGPLERPVPSNMFAMAMWNFGREYRAIRKSLKAGELSEFVDALSGAEKFRMAQEGLSHKLEGLSEAERSAKLREEFTKLDADASGTLSASELMIALRDLGVETSEREARGFLKLATDEGAETITCEQFELIVNTVLEGGDRADLLFREKAGYLPTWMANAAMGLIKAVGGVDRKVDESLSARIRPFGYEEADGPTRELQKKLDQLVLSNDAVYQREEIRRGMLERSLSKAMTEEDSPGQRELVDSLKATKSPSVIMGPYVFLCWFIDVVFANRPIQRFWFLENVARMPYFSYNYMLTMYEALGWWKSSSDTRRVHFAEEWNEVQHLKIMEALGGDKNWIDRFLGRHAALFYFVILNHIWLISPSFAYNFSELIEFHAVDSYGEFVDANEKLLRSLPPPQEALDYYKGEDMYLFDEFQTGRKPKSRRPKIESLYDVFCNIRDDELEHVKTMFQCQTSASVIGSPNQQAAKAQRKVEDSSQTEKLIQVKMREVKSLEEKLRQQQQQSAKV